MKTFINERPEIDLALLKEDRFAFSVLTMILGSPCAKTITDDRSFILCLSGEPYPVWVWTSEDISDEGLAEVMKITLSEWPKQQHHYNMKYRAAEYFLAHEEGLSIFMNMMTYECPEPLTTPDFASGKARPVGEEDLDLLIDWLNAFGAETGVDAPQQERDVLLGKIEERSMYFWIDEQRKPVCLCGFRPTDDGFGRIGPVYTPPEERRKHYAETLVYAVSQEVIRRGSVPTLYTNADYAASNACYRKVGFQLRGTLCTVGRRGEG